jgi:hypothetical protein
MTYINDVNLNVVGPFQGECYRFGYLRGIQHFLAGPVSTDRLPQIRIR